MFDIGIITAPRVPSYIGGTLDSIFDIWPNANVHTFEEPGVVAYYNQSKCARHHNERTLGCVENWLRAAEYMLNVTKSPFVMMCEDDISFNSEVEAKAKIISDVYFNPKQNAFRERYPIQKIGFFSFYTSLANDDKKVTSGWFQPFIRKSGWCGALCLLLPCTALTLLLDKRDDFIAAASKYAEYPKHLDYAIGEVLTKNKLFLFSHKPTLVQHVGVVSTFETLSTKYNYAREPLL